MTSIPSGGPSVGSYGMSRRRFLGTGLAAAAGLMGLSGCGSAVAAGVTGGGLGRRTVDYWNLFGGGDGVRMTAMVDGFRKANPALDVRATTFAWGNPYYTKLSLATLGNKGPDVAVSHLTRAKTLISADLLQELQPDDLARHGMTPDKFNQRAWQAGLVDGKAYAIPLDTHPFVLFYNTAVCKKAGLLDSTGMLKPLVGEAAFIDAMKRAKQVTGEYGGVVPIVNETSTPWRMFQSLYSQLRGQMLAEDGTKVVIDDAKAMRVLTFMQSLTAKKYFPAQIDYQGAIAQMANGKAGFYLQGEWEISTFQTAKTPFSMTLFPRVFTDGPYACQADSHTLVLPRWPGSDRARLDRALLFIRSMLDQSKVWAEGGHIPAWLPFRESATYKDMKPQSFYASAADAAVYDPPGWYSGSGSNFEIVTGSIIGAVLAGQLSPEAAITQMRTKLTALATTPSPI
jgi:multiple sugar transport system substrate-binding protein